MLIGSRRSGHNIQYKSGTVIAEVIGKDKEVLLCVHRGSKIELTVPYSSQFGDIEIGQSIQLVYKRTVNYVGYVVGSALMSVATLDIVSSQHILGKNGDIYISLVFSNIMNRAKGREHVLITPKSRFYDKALVLVDGDRVTAKMNADKIFDIEESSSMVKMGSMTAEKKQAVLNRR